MIHKCEPGRVSAPVFLQADPHCINCTIAGYKVCIVLLLTGFVKHFIEIQRFAQLQGDFLYNMHNVWADRLPVKMHKKEAANLCNMPKPLAPPETERLFASDRPARQKVTMKCICTYSKHIVNVS